MTDDDEDPEIIVCQGPPVCLLEGDAAVEAAQKGCPWCKHIVVHPDGTDTVTDPIERAN